MDATLTYTAHLNIAAVTKHTPSCGTPTNGGPLQHNSERCHTLSICSGTLKSPWCWLVMKTCWMPIQLSICGMQWKNHNPWKAPPSNLLNAKDPLPRSWWQTMQDTTRSQHPLPYRSQLFKGTYTTGRAGNCKVMAGHSETIFYSRKCLLLCFSHTIWLFDSYTVILCADLWES